jgi:hypothetical protein
MLTSENKIKNILDAYCEKLDFPVVKVIDKDIAYANKDFLARLNGYDMKTHAW